MKFIFPQNYNFSSKFLGFVDYKTAVFNVILWVVYYIVTIFLHMDLLFRIVLFISICFPIFLISFFCFKQESITYVLKYLYIFLKSNKLYLYNKSN